jgi:CARDB protein
LLQRRYSSASVLGQLCIVLWGLLVQGCDTERAPLPTQGTSPDLVGEAAGINQMLTDLLPAGPLLDEARAEVGVTHEGPGRNPASTRRWALRQANSILKAYRAGRLLDPNGPAPPTTQEAVVQVIDAYLAFAALPPSGISPDALGPTGRSGASAVFGRAGGNLVTGERLAGLVVPPDAVSEDHLFLISRRDDLALQGICLSTPLPQFPLCYEFIVVPKTTFSVPVTVVECQLEPPPPHPIYNRLVLAHPDPNVLGAIQFTTRVADPFGLVCTDAVLLPGGGGLTSVLRRVGAFAVSAILPRPLYAGHGGMGGSVQSFSPFIAVDPVADLIVESLSHAPAEPTIADLITVTAVVKNNSPVPTGPFSVAFALGVVEAPVVSIAGLPGGASVPVSVLIGPRLPGTYQDTVTIDVGSAVVEFNEANNTLTSAAYTVSAPLPPPPLPLPPVPPPPLPPAPLPPPPLHLTPP